MQPANRPIFRSEAVRRYADRHEKAVLPRLVRPRVFLFLWLLLGLLLAGGAVAWFARVPDYASGRAVVARLPAEGASGGERIVVVAFLPAASHARLRVGQPMWVQWDGAAGPVSTSLSAIQPQLSSPEAVRKRFSLGPEEAGAITGPVAVVTASMAAEAGVPADARVGSVGHAQVEIGSRRVFSLLLGLASWGEEPAVCSAGFSPLPRVRSAGFSPLPSVRSAGAILRAAETWPSDRNPKRQRGPQAVPSLTLRVTILPRRAPRSASPSGSGKQRNDRLKPALQDGLKPALQTGVCL